MRRHATGYALRHVRATDTFFGYIFAAERCRYICLRRHATPRAVPDMMPCSFFILRLGGFMPPGVALRYELRHILRRCQYC